MLENITLGQYYPLKSPVHALDPRVKILLLVAYITAVFLVPDLTGFILITLYLAVACKLSKLPFRLLIKGLKPLRMILIFTFILNLFFTGGTTPLLNLGFAVLTPLLPYLSKGGTDLVDLRLVFWLHLMEVASSSFFFASMSARHLSILRSHSTVC